MTITDLKAYKSRMDEKLLPTDKLRVILNRDAYTMLSVILADRNKKLRQSLSDPKISESKRAKRTLELDMVVQAIKCFENTEKVN